MSQISLKSISGITSITTPAGVDNRFSLYNFDSTERLVLDHTGNLNISGVSTATNFKTGTTNVHNVGVEAAGINVLGADTPIGAGSTIYNSGAAVFTGVVTATTFSGSGASLTNLNASAIASGTVPTARLGSGTANSSTFLAGDSTFKTVTGTTINNNADNRVITGSGTANTLEGEANLTFSGSVLSVTGNISLPDSTAPDYVGNIYVGNNSDLKIFHNGSDNFIRSGAGNANIRIDNNSGVLGARFIPAGAAELYHNGTKMCETSTNGLAFPAGKGIDFSADGNNSGMDNELLDDYEEGSWSALPSTGGTFTGCRYVKVGNLCLATGSVGNLPTHSGSNIEIYGLPFNNRNSGVSGQVVYLGALRGYNLGTNVGNSRPPTTIVLENSRITIGTGQGNGGWDMLQYNELGSSSNAIQFSILYQTA